MTLAIWNVIDCPCRMILAPIFAPGLARHRRGDRACARRADSAAYAASKGAFELLVRTHANETITSLLRVNLFNPGPPRTHMRATRFPNEDPLTLDTPTQVAEMLLELCVPSFAETGRIYDYRYKKLLSYRPPG